MDVIMPGMGGYQVLTKLKESPAYRSIGVVIFSSASDEDLERKCFEKGAEAFWIKPYNYDAAQARKLFQSGTELS